LEICRKNHDEIGEAVILAELGFTISVNGDHTEGLKLLYDALAIAKKINNPNALGIVYDNLGVCTVSDHRLKKNMIKMH
jgi:hypothetical protein